MADDDFDQFGDDDNANQYNDDSTPANDSSDSATETSTDSWGSRLAGSLMGIIFGIILFIAAFPFLWWNEGHSLHRIRTLDEGRNLVVSVSPEQIDPNNNGKLIHVAAKATTNEVLNDDLFGVHETAIKLNRVVEMYQWKEAQSTQKHKNLGGSETTETTYSYTKEWSDKLINSSTFKKRDEHQNPTTMPYTSQTFTADDITVGAFKPTGGFIDKINKPTDYTLTEQNASAMNDQLKSYFKLSGNDYFYGDPANPLIGSLRVHYTIVSPTDVSIVGKQNSNSIEPYYTKNGDIALLEIGNVGADSMFTSAEDENMLMTWGLRLGGFALMWLGVSMIFRPIAVLGDVVPFIGDILGGGVAVITGLFALVVSLVTIAIAWILLRPLIGIGLLLAAAAFMYGGMNLVRSGKAKLVAKLSHKKQSATPINTNS